MLNKFFIAAIALCAGAVFAAPEVNKATAAELDAIKGVGPALSATIIQERKKGDFKDWPDLMNRVKGVREKKAAKLSTEGLTVNGAVFSSSMKTDKPQGFNKTERTLKPAEKMPADSSIKG